MILHIQLHLAVKWKAFPRGFGWLFLKGRKRGVRLIHVGGLYTINYGILFLYIH